MLYDWSIEINCLHFMYRMYLDILAYSLSEARTARQEEIRYEKKSNVFSKFSEASDTRFYASTSSKQHLDGASLPKDII